LPWDWPCAANAAGSAVEAGKKLGCAFTNKRRFQLLLQLLFLCLEPLFLSRHEVHSFQPRNFIINTVKYYEFFIHPWEKKAILLRHKNTRDLEYRSPV